MPTGKTVCSTSRHPYFSISVVYGCLSLYRGTVHKGIIIYVYCSTDFCAMRSSTDASNVSNQNSLGVLWCWSNAGLQLAIQTHSPVTSQFYLHQKFQPYKLHLMLKKKTNSEALKRSCREGEANGWISSAESLLADRKRGLYVRTHYYSLLIYVALSLTIVRSSIYILACKGSPELLQYRLHVVFSVGWLVEKPHAARHDGFTDRIENIAGKLMVGFNAWTEIRCIFDSHFRWLHHG